MYPPHEVFFSLAQTTYPAGSHKFQPIAVGAGYQSLAMKATKINWPRGIADVVVGHIELSDDGGQTWRHAVTWRDDGGDVHDDSTGAVLDYSFVQFTFSARSDKPVYTHEKSWVRGIFECKVPMTTAITIERA